MSRALSLTQTHRIKGDPVSSTDSEFAELRRTVSELADRVKRLEATNEARQLQFKYGYYPDKCLYQEVVDLYSADGEVVFAGGSTGGALGSSGFTCTGSVSGSPAVTTARSGASCSTT
jgi:hypothetical protein